MKCSRCGFEMADTKTYCNQCGTVLRSSPSSSPQMNNYRPPPASEYGMQSQAFSYQQLSLSPRIGVFSAILYFMAALIAAFGFVGMFMTFGTDTRISAIAVFFGLGSLLVSVFIFLRMRHRVPLLHWWQRILWILGATVGGFMLIILASAFFPTGLFSNYSFGLIFLLYGFTWAGIALW
jgi:hypothetical protein